MKGLFKTTHEEIEEQTRNERRAYTIDKSYRLHKLTTDFAISFRYKKETKQQ